jgi:hypothetical protein
MATPSHSPVDRSLAAVLAAMGASSARLIGADEAGTARAARFWRKFARSCPRAAHD